MMEEMMVADSTYHSRYSKMSLAVAIDSGFYKADLNKAEEFYFNKDQGCRAYSKKCPKKNTDFCKKENAGERTCSENHDYISYCNTGTFPGTDCGIIQQFEYCRKERIEESNLSEYGREAKCGYYKVIFT